MAPSNKAITDAAKKSLEVEVRFEYDRFGRKRMLFDDAVKQQRYDALFRLGNPGSEIPFDITNWRDLSKLCYPKFGDKLGYPFENSAFADDWQGVNEAGEKLKYTLLNSFLGNANVPDTLIVADKSENLRSTQPFHINLKKDDARGTLVATADDGLPQVKNPVQEPAKPGRWARFWNTVTFGLAYSNEINTYNTQKAAYDAQAEERERVAHVEEIVRNQLPHMDQLPSARAVLSGSEKQLGRDVAIQDSIAEAKQRRMDLYGLDAPDPRIVAKPVERLRNSAEVFSITDEAGLHFAPPPTMRKEDYALFTHMAMMTKDVSDKMITVQVTKPEERPVMMCVHSTEDINRGRDGLEVLTGAALQAAHAKTQLAITRQYMNDSSYMGKIVAEAAPLMARFALRGETGLTTIQFCAIDECKQVNDYLKQNPLVLDAAKQNGLAQKDMDALQACSNIMDIHEKASKAREQLLTTPVQDTAKCRELALDIMTENYVNAIVAQHNTDLSDQGLARATALMAQAAEKVPGETEDQKKERVNALSDMATKAQVIVNGSAPLNDAGIPLLNDPEALRTKLSESPIMKHMDELVGNGVSYLDAVREATNNADSARGKKQLIAQLPLTAQQPANAPAQQAEVAPQPVAGPTRSIKEMRQEAGMPEQKAKQNVNEANMGRHSHM